MNIHTCSYYCDRPECVLAQRDELRQKLEQAIQAEREACAKLVEGMVRYVDGNECAKAIRARGEK
jgi:hypothetical protein